MDRSREALNIAGALVAGCLMAVLGFITWALVYVEVPSTNREALTVLIGILSANVGLVVGFFFGSTVTNKRQAETIDTMARTLPQQHHGDGHVTLQPGAEVTVEAER